MNVVGVSGGFGHDAAACLVRDGQLVAAAEEERFIRRKNAPNCQPIHSLLYCLNAGGIDLQDVDCIAFSWDPSKETESSLPEQRALALLEHSVISGRHRAEVVYVDHHVAHGAAAFYASGLANAGVLVVDGHGEAAATTLLAGCQQGMRPITDFGVEHSLGLFYEAASVFVGLEAGLEGPGKLMGLAAYGSPAYGFPEIETTDDGYRMPISLPPSVRHRGRHDGIVEQWLDLFTRRFGDRIRSPLSLDMAGGRLRNGAEVFGARNANVAASVQHVLERLLLHLGNLSCRMAGSRNLVLAGGVALNCSANGLLRRSRCFDEIYVFPAAGDSGGAVGAAFEVASRLGEPPPHRIAHGYWGPEYSPDAIEGLLRRNGLTFRRSDEIWTDIGHLLLKGEIGGWFQGRAEFGPRALGHRSILASPASKAIADRVNVCKGRESWRPLAPSVTAATAAGAFGLRSSAPFMLEAVQVSPDWAHRLEGVVHVDGSTRPHTVEPWTDLAYGELLRWLERATGVGAVLNTSFNTAGEPIVCTPSDALRTFYSSGLDFLVLGPMLLHK
jgi:carbamoyltransferase